MSVSIHSKVLCIHNGNLLAAILNCKALKSTLTVIPLCSKEKDGVEEADIFLKEVMISALFLHGFLLFHNYPDKPLFS